MSQTIDRYPCSHCVETDAFVCLRTRLAGHTVPAGVPCHCACHGPQRPPRRKPRAAALTQADLLTACGVTQSLKAWIAATGMPYLLLKSRLAYGWSFEECVTTPPPRHQPRGDVL